MKRMTRKNLYNIKEKVARETGVSFRYSGVPVRKMAVLAAAAVCCLALAAFARPLFTPLNGDELSLLGVYRGAGIVEICVKNGSDRDLEFQEQTRLMCWVPDEEVKPIGGNVVFENTFFPANSEGTMTVDLSQAYDIAALEMEGKNLRSYYLLLTNRDFLFGHDWMCSFTFEREETAAEEEGQAHRAARAEGLEEMEASLRFYFEDAYGDQVTGLNEANFAYLQKVDECITRFEGTVASPLAPVVAVGGQSQTLDPDPYIVTEGENVDCTWVTVDGYHRLIGGKMGEKALAVTALVPSRQYPDSFRAIPLVYTLVYRREDAKAENWAFFYGQFHSFGELEEEKVYEDENYAVFDITDWLYRDLEGYLDFVQETDADLLLDEDARRELRGICERCREELGQRIGYRNGG